MLSSAKKWFAAHWRQSVEAVMKCTNLQTVVPDQADQWDDGVEYSQEAQGW